MSKKVVKFFEVLGGLGLLLIGVNAMVGCLSVAIFDVPFNSPWVDYLTRVHFGCMGLCIPGLFCTLTGLGED